MENRKTVILILRVICAISFIWLALTTGYTVYQASQGWGNKWLIVAAVLTMFILVDSYGQSLGKFTIRGVIDQNFRNDIGGLTFIIVFMLFAGRFTASTFMTYIASKPLTESITPPPDTNNDQAAIEKAQAARSGNLEALKDEKERLERSETTRIREAEKAGKKLVDEAINAGGSGFAKLYRENNPWVKKEPKFRKTRDAIKAAKVQADGLVYIEKEATREAQRAYMAALGGKDEVATALASVMKSKADRYESKVSRYTIALYLVDFAAAILAIITLIAIVKHEVKTGTQYKGVFNEVLSKVGSKVQSDVLEATEKTALSGWTLIFTGFSKIPTFLTWLNIVFWVRLIGWIEIQLKQDIDGNGNIGNTSAQQSANTSANTPTFRPVIGGFAQHRNEAQPPTNLPTNNAQNVGAFSPTSPTQNTTKSANVGVTPTSPTHIPTTPPPTQVQTSVNEQPDAQPPTPTNHRRKTPTQRQEAPTKDRAAGDKELAAMADAARAAFKRYMKDSNNGTLFARWQEWEKELKRNGFTISRSPAGTQVTIIKPKPRKKK